MLDSSLTVDSRAATPIPAAILRCPITHSNLRLLTSDEVQSLNQQIADRSLRHVDGSPVEQSLEAGLASDRGGLAYKIVDGIAVLLPSLAIVLDDSEAIDRICEMNSDKSAVRRFYEETGWDMNERGDFVDAEIWEDLRPVAADYIRRCHGRVSRHVPPSGRYLLDVASGPVQYPEYRKYSADYAARICVDISFTALRAARRQLGDHGIYVLGDITNLPLRDNSVDGCVSLHTIYHVPASEQAQAFRELHRVLKPGGSAAVVYSWKSRALKLAALPAKLAALPMKLWRAVWRKRLNPTERQRAKPKSCGKFYYHAYRYQWFVRQQFPFAIEVRTWRSVNIPILKAYFYDLTLGRAALAALFWLEEKFPHFFGRFGAYPLIVIRKE